MKPGTPYRRVRGEHKVNHHQTGLGQRTIVSVNEGTRHPDTVLAFQQKWRRQDQVHPTQKPVELLEYLIKTYTQPGEMGLDNTMGSGSTGVAAVQTRRAFIGIELDASYFQTACQRIRQALDSRSLPLTE